jgi:hypothetical protein
MNRSQQIKRRVRRIRRSVAAFAGTLFTVAFLGIYVQLASGHDPALLATAHRRASTSATTAHTDKASTSSASEASTTQSSKSTSPASSGGASSSSGSTESSSSITTSQS